MPSLEGLRAVSILLVLLGHLSGTRKAWNIDLGMGDYAHLGVVVFFVISGFLITSLLIAEETVHGRISLKLFYARRALRIFPASYTYILVIGILYFLGQVSAHAADFWHAVSYTVNFAPVRAWQVGHLWSLSVEEQFYLLWPFAFVTLGMRRAVWVAAIVLLLGPAARSGNWLLLRGTPYHDLEMFPMVADSLAAGCLLAQLRPWLEQLKWYTALFRGDISCAILAAIFVANRFLPYTIVGVFGMSFINVGIAFLVHRSVYRQHDISGNFLNWRPVAFVGTLSYSLYLWQQLFLNRNSTAWINAFPQNLVLAFAAAALSYLCLEKPLMKLRSRLRH